jgi:hypothetical protein
MTPIIQLFINVAAADITDISVSDVLLIKPDLPKIRIPFLPKMNPEY